METKKHTAANKKTLSLVLALALLLAAGAGLWYVKVADVAEGQSFLPPCLLYKFTGLYCTGCGITRALHHILNGHLYAGLRMNPLAVLSLPFLLWIAGLVLWRTWRGRPLPNIPAWFPWAVLAVIIVYTVARNLPWQPFSWLAPTQVPWVR